MDLIVLQMLRFSTDHGQSLRQTAGTFCSYHIPFSPGITIRSPCRPCMSLCTRVACIQPQMALIAFWMDWEEFETLEMNLKCVSGSTSTSFDCFLNGIWAFWCSWSGFEVPLRCNLKWFWLFFELNLNHLRFLRWIWGSVEVQPQIVYHLKTYDFLWFSLIWGPIRLDFYNIKLKVGYNLKGFPSASAWQKSCPPAL